MNKNLDIDCEITESSQTKKGMNKTLPASFIPHPSSLILPPSLANSDLSKRVSVIERDFLQLIVASA